MGNFVDPDCIEEDLVVEEPSQEIDADFALGLPDLRLDFGSNEPEEDCVDDIVPTEPQVEQAATEECEDPIETTVEPEAAPTEAECVDEPITTEAPQNQPPLKNVSKKKPSQHQLTNAPKKTPTKSPQH